MKPTIETGNVSQQPECLRGKRYEVILDFGKPSSEKVATLEEVRALVQTGYELFQEDGTGDVLVYDNGFDITDSQVIQEMIGEIMEAGEELLSPAPKEEPEEDHPIDIEEKVLDEMEEEAMEECHHALDNTEGEMEAFRQQCDEHEAKMKATCTYGDAPATTKCSACGEPLCSSCGFTLGESKLCNKCWELDPR